MISNFKIPPLRDKNICELFIRRSELLRQTQFQFVSMRVDNPNSDELHKNGMEINFAFIFVNYTRKCRK